MTESRAFPGTKVFTTWANHDGSQVTFVGGDDPPEGEGWRLIFAIHGPSYAAALVKCRIMLGLEASLGIHGEND